jgi:hypothetical protein
MPSEAGVERRDGRNSCFVDGPREKRKSNPKVIKAIVQFVTKTRRFQPKANIAEDARVVEGARLAEETEESDDESVRCSL